MKKKKEIKFNPANYAPRESTGSRVSMIIKEKKCRRKKQGKETQFREPIFKCLSQCTCLKATFYNEIEHVTYSEQERLLYFEKLYTLFDETKWRHLQSWDKSYFFKMWFIAISNEYMSIYKKFESLAIEIFPDYNENKEFDNPCFIHGKLEFLFTLTLQFLDVCPWRGGREHDLKKRWLDDVCGATHYPPAKLLPVEEAVRFNNFKIELSKVIKYEQTEGCQGGKAYDASEEYEALKLFSVDARYPVNVILKEMESIIKNEQIKYYSKFPDKRVLFIKETKDGRLDTYPFDEWERYLRVFMLKQQNKKTREIAEMFYNRNASPERQVLRDYKKAKNISKNAVEHNFPGNY